MRRQFLQIEKKMHLITGVFLIPVFLTVLMLKAGIADYNFTGLLDMPGYSLWIKIAACMILCWMIFSIWLIFRRNTYQISRRYFMAMAALFSFCAVMALMIPYDASSASATCHLFFAYAAFAVFNVLWITLIYDHQRYRLVYCCGLCFCALLCFTAGAVTGAAELIYACMVSAMLALLGR